MKLETLDIGVFIAYVLGLLILALWISRGEKITNVIQKIIF
jgi:SSS family solute:Na+ symporter